MHVKVCYGFMEDENRGHVVDEVIKHNFGGWSHTGPDAY